MVPPLRLRENISIEDTVDLDVLYVARSPVYGYRQAKTFPDVGEFVTYTAFVANRGGMATGRADLRFRSPLGDAVALGRGAVRVQ